MEPVGAYLTRAYTTTTKCCCCQSSLFQNGEVKYPSYNIIDHSNLVQISHFGGRGLTTLVRSYLGSEVLYILKGLEFDGFPGSHAECLHRKNVLYHETQPISSLPRHPNIGTNKVRRYRGP